MSTKYAIIVPDGAADEPLGEFGGQTILEAADIPNTDKISTEGRQGIVRTIPKGFDAGSDVTINSGAGLLLIDGFIEAQDQLSLTGGTSDLSGISIMLTRLVFKTKTNEDGYNYTVGDVFHLEFF